MRVSARDRVACLALGVANVGSGIYIASEPAYLGADAFVTTLGTVGIFLALPALIAATTGWRGRWADEGLFVNGVYWVFITALFALARWRNGFTAIGITFVLVAATIAAFGLWLGLRRAEARDDA